MVTVSDEVNLLISKIVTNQWKPSKQSVLGHLLLRAADFCHLARRMSACRTEAPKP